MEKALKYIYGVLVLGLLVTANFSLWLEVSNTYLLRTGLAEIFQGLSCPVDQGPGIVRLK